MTADCDGDRLCPRCLEILDRKARDGLLLIVFEDPIDQIVANGVLGGLTHAEIVVVLQSHGVSLSRQAVSLRVQALKKSYPSLAQAFSFFGN